MISSLKDDFVIVAIVKSASNDSVHFFQATFLSVHERKSITLDPNE